MHVAHQQNQFKIIFQLSGNKSKISQRRNTGRLSDRLRLVYQKLK